MTKIGDTVGLLAGLESVTGKVTGIDTSTYIVDIVSVKLLTGKYAGETVAQTSGQLFDPKLACQ